MDKRLWCPIPHDFLDLEFDNVPRISNEKATANTNQEKKREPKASCWLAVALMYSSFDRTRAQPPRTFAIV